MKRISCTLALLTTTLNAGDWVQGIMSGVDTMVTVAIHTHVYLEDWEDSQLTTHLDRYEYYTDMKYPLGNHFYSTKWLMFRDVADAPRYETREVYDNVVKPIVYEAFEIGMSTGKPMTKRQWKCNYMSPTVWYDAHSTGSMRFKLKHTVTKAAQFASRAPSQHEWQVYTLGWMWNPECGPIPTGTGSWSTTQTIQRNQFTVVEYDATNVEVNDIYSREKR